ncbi:unnamed protein product [Mytilus coruscus]|uniref:Uncharacterized protein n=1 Tax=Mytilus coruscus TaxID=42192 RepID=A0A6J8BH23_MYTCO|nr:unnamed protein product [Mytilus coruscus]
MIRRYVKKWLHLPSCTTDHLFYTSTAMGGLGLPRLSKSAPCSRINTKRAVLNSKDENITSFVKTTGIEDEIRDTADKLNIRIPSNPKRPATWRKNEEKEWAAQPAAGKGGSTSNTSVRTAGYSYRLDRNTSGKEISSARSKSVRTRTPLESPLQGPTEEKILPADAARQRQKRRKSEKYLHLVPVIKEQFGVTEVTVRGLAVGARGGWCKGNAKTMEIVGLNDKGLHSFICRFALRGTLNLLRLFTEGRGPGARTATAPMGYNVHSRSKCVKRGKRNSIQVRKDSQLESCPMTRVSTYNQWMPSLQTMTYTEVH